MQTAIKPFLNLIRNKAVFFSFVAVAMLLIAPNSYAQETGQIAGTVTDSSGATVAGAVLTAKNVNTNAVRSVTTTNSGSFDFTNLEPATYEVTSQPAGFAVYKAKVELPVGAHITLDVKLAVGSNATTVEVSAASGVQVNTQTQELSQVVDRQQVSQLPSLTRNPYDFVALSGNISSGDDSGPGKSQNATSRGVGFSINGQRSTGTEILLDGVENISVFGEGVGILVPIDAVQEFSVMTSNFLPQYGRASGGVVNVATRSGSNSFHGNVWEFNRLAAYTSNTVTNAQEGIDKGQYTRNQFGFAVGGPILKDKLFFFGSTEWIRVRSSAASSAAVPTSQFLSLAAPNIQNYFSTYGANQSFNVISTTDNATIAANNGGTPIANVPLSTPVFQTVGFNAPGDAGGGVPQNTYNIVGRVDYNLGEKTQMFFRYVDYNELDEAGSQFSSPYAAYNVGQSIKNQAYLFSATHEFTPVISSITKLSFSRFNTSLSYDKSLQNVPTLVTSVNASLPGSPSTLIQLPGFYDTNPGDGGLPFGGPQNTVQINQDLSVVKGKHSAQFGGQILYIQDNEAYGAYAQANEQLGVNKAAGLQNLQSGDLFEFQAAVNPNGALPCVANQYTGELTQTPGCSINLPATSPSFARSNRFHDWAVYGQDTLKLTPKMTLNYGLRYEYYGVQHNNNGSLDSNFFFGPGSNLAQQIRSGQVLTSPNSPVGGLWSPQYGTASPRIGFAYDVFGNGKTSFRGGYGISYERNFGNVTFNVIQNPPNYAVIVVNNTVVTNSNAGPLAGGSGNVALPPTSLRNVSQNIRTAQTQFWSAAIEQELAPGTIFSLQYVGSRGLHLYDIKNYNGIGSGNALLGDPVTDPNPADSDPVTGAPQALTRLNPQYSNINNRGSNGDSYYEGMNIQLQSRNLYHSGVSLVANYTFAHETDDLSTTFSETNNAFSLGYTDPFNPSLDHGNGDLDIRNRFVIAPIYRTPTLQRGLLNEALGGWQVTGIYTVRTGTPFTYFDSTNNQSGYNVARYTPADGVVPQRTFKKIPGGTSSGGSNSYAIGTLPDAYSFGNPDLLGASDWGPFPSTMTARNAFRGPGAWSFDASVSKTFPIHEQINLEFRAEAFDLLNHHNLYIQEAENDVANGNNEIFASKGGIGAGTPAGANDERRFGQFALKINF
ncbi:TonB-dependent receptor [Tunturiibacter lichenicola]|uniref:TonB-dependent receptor n=1 Tax=Tunturiibacter lichenicola TaxID=2051959 RepID=UPI0021B43A01|nr:TonB-dependent receptor [Edaphobacter lichenicola]